MEHPKYLEQQFLNEQMADVIFIMKTGEQTAKIPAHKVILAASSSVFAKRFNEIIDLNEIEINNASSAAFREFLYAFYAKHPEKHYTFQNIVTVLHLARAFDFGFCTSTCEQFLVENLSDRDIIFGYGVAIEFQLCHLKTHCQQQINWKKNAVLTSLTFFECAPRVFHDLVRDLKIAHSDEIRLVWDACLYWVQVHAGKQPSNIVEQLEFLCKHFDDVVSGGEDFQAYAKKHYDHLFTCNVLAKHDSFEIQNTLIAVRLRDTMLSTAVCGVSDVIEIEFKCTKKIVLTGIAFATVTGPLGGNFSIGIRRDDGESHMVVQKLKSKPKSYDETRNFVAIDGGGIILAPNQTYIVRVNLHKNVVFYRSYTIQNHFAQHGLSFNNCENTRDIFSHFFFDF